MSVTDEDARRLRRLWFAYLDTLEPLRPALHGYALRLTGNLWDAEDLVQETLLRGYAMTGRGDLHGERSPVANARAYLFRTATHLYIDQVRRAQAALRQAATAPEPALASTAEPAAAQDGFVRLTALASPQERAAVVLKDVFDFTLEEAADCLRTTPGAVKAALRRGRERLAADDEALSRSRRPSPPKAVLDAFVDAFNRRDAAAVAAILAEECSIEVLGVGGGRGSDSDWVRFSLEESRVSLSAGDLAGEAVVLAMVDGERLGYVIRLEADDGRVTRIIDYCYCRDTLAGASAALGFEGAYRAYHQSSAILERMIASTTLPWRAV
jgi:RNA polymerase sigma-70 factor (ECF subfamily)